MAQLRGGLSLQPQLKGAPYCSSCPSSSPYVGPCSPWDCRCPGSILIYFLAVPGSLSGSLSSVGAVLAASPNIWVTAGHRVGAHFLVLEIWK